MKKYSIIVFFIVLFYSCTPQDKTIKKDIVEDSKEDFLTLKTKGIESFNEKNYIKSQKFLENAVKINPDDSEVLYILGEISQIQKANLKAFHYYQKAHQLNKEDNKISLKYGQMLLIQKKYTQAADLLEKVYKNDNSKIDVAVSLLGIYSSIINKENKNEWNNYKIKMEHVAQKALKEQPGDIAVYTNMAIFYAKTEQIPLAAYIFSIAEKNGENSAVLLNNLGWFNEIQDKQLKAKYYYQKALSKDPSYIPALRNTIRFEMESLNYQGALPLLKKLDELEPDNENTTYGIALAFLGVRNFKESIEYFEKLYKNYSKKDFYSLILGDIYYKHLATSQEVLDKKKQRNEILKKAQHWYNIYVKLNPNIKQNNPVLTALEDIKMQLNTKGNI